MQVTLDPEEVSVVKGALQGCLGRLVGKKSRRPAGRKSPKAGTNFQCAEENKGIHRNLLCLILVTG